MRIMTKLVDFSVRLKIILFRLIRSEDSIKVIKSELGKVPTVFVYRSHFKFYASGPGLLNIVEAVLAYTKS